MTSDGPHCNFFVIRKKRYCRMLVKRGEKYCGEHQKLSDSADYPINDTKLRIVCPLDRKQFHLGDLGMVYNIPLPSFLSHCSTCYAHHLKKHLLICNAREQDVPVYIQKGINSGKETSQNADDNVFKSLCTFSPSQIIEVVTKVNKIYEDSVKGKITENILSTPLLEEEMQNSIYGDRTKKHLKQASSILGLLQEYNLIKDNATYIEFGAGRGQLSYWISKSTENMNEVSIILVEKASPKHKRDNKLAKSTDKVQRIRADISDLVLDKLNIISKSKHIIAITKHLCGGATDLAIRCLTNTSQNKDKVSGGILTFCCHHRCQWTSYTGKQFFRENGLTKDHFSIMCGMASWATCGTGLSREKRNGEPKDLLQNQRDKEIGLSREEKEEVGKRCKNIMNWGRLVYLQQLGFNCVLHYYVCTDISLENVCIVAYRH